MRLIVQGRWQRRKFEEERKQAAELEVRKMQLESEQKMWELEQQKKANEMERRAQQQAAELKHKQMEMELEKQRMQAQMMQQQQHQQQEAAAAQFRRRQQREAGAPQAASNDPIRKWLQGADTPPAAAALAGGGRANVNQLRPQSIQDVMLWLNDIGMGKYRQQFQVNEIDGEMLMQLKELDLGEIGVPAWSGDRQRIFAAIEHLKNPNASPPPVNPAPSVVGGYGGVSVAGSVAGSARQMERVPDSPVNEWLLSTGFGRFRAIFSQYQILELHDLCQMERQDLLDLGIPDQVRSLLLPCSTILILPPCLFLESCSCPLAVLHPAWLHPRRSLPSSMYPPSCTSRFVTVPPPHAPTPCHSRPPQTQTLTSSARIIKPKPSSRTYMVSSFL